MYKLANIRVVARLAHLSAPLCGVHIRQTNAECTHSFACIVKMWIVKQERTSDGECLRLHFLTFPRMLVNEGILKDARLKPMTVSVRICFQQQITILNCKN